MTMELRLTAFFVLLILLQTCVTGTPIHRGFKDRLVNWKTCKSKAIALNQLARKFSLYMNETCGMSAKVDDSKIGAQDLCDPFNIGQTETCLQSITSVLQNFSAIFGKDGLFQKTVLTQMAAEVNTAVTGLLSELGETGTPVNTMKWGRCLLQRHMVERLFSFSVLSARVFSFLADPVKSGVDSSSRCN